MQVTETPAAGLKREYRVVVPATDLEAKVNERLDELKGPRAAARLPARQGAGRAPQAPLWQIRHGRGDRSRGARGQYQDRHRPRLQARDRAQSRAAVGGGRGRRRHRRQVRPRLHGRDGDRAADRARRFQDHQAHAAHRRGDRRRDRQGAADDRRAEPAVRRQDRRRGKWRSRHHRF